MKKIISIILFVLFAIYAKAEYAVIDGIVYNLYVSDMTAWVYNFQTSTDTHTKVTIPATITYKTEKYVVEGLSYNGFKSSVFGTWYDYKLSGYDYDIARSYIEELILPNTIKVISPDAFTGMVRLTSLVIPESVEEIQVSNKESQLLYNKPRLQKIVILGTPAIKSRWSDITYIDKINSLGDYVYIQEMKKSIAGVDSIGKSNECRNLKQFSMPKAEKILAVKIAQRKQMLAKEEALRKYWISLNKRLRDSVESYNSLLKQNPYYDGSTIFYSKYGIDVNIEEVAQQSNGYKRLDSLYQSELNRIKQEYEERNSQMATNLRQKNPTQYLAAYKNEHPEIKPVLDSIENEYRCYSTNEKVRILINYVEHKSITELSCREQQYSEYGKFFVDKSEFDKVYDKYRTDSEFIILEIIARRQKADAQDKLQRLVQILSDNPSVSLKGVLTPNNKVQQDIAVYLKYLRENDYCKSAYNEAIEMVFKVNKKINKEYEKNGKYFESKHDFFEAYITESYNDILKVRKKKR